MTNSSKEVNGKNAKDTADNTGKRIKASHSKRKQCAVRYQESKPNQDTGKQCLQCDYADQLEIRTQH